MASKTQKFFLWFGVFAALLGISIPLFGLLPLEPPYNTWSACVFWAAVGLEIFCILMQFDIRGAWARFRGKDMGRGTVCAIVLVVALESATTVRAEARNNDALIAEFRHAFLKILPPQMSRLEDTCQAYKAYQEKLEAFQDVDERNLWSESQVLISKNDAWKVLRGVGIETVKRLASVRQLPLEGKKDK